MNIETRELNPELLPDLEKGEKWDRVKSPKAKIAGNRQSGKQRVRRKP